jgi:hypothetical protein
MTTWLYFLFLLTAAVAIVSSSRAIIKTMKKNHNNDTVTGKNQSDFSLYSIE